MEEMDSIAEEAPEAPESIADEGAEEQAAEGQETQAEAPAPESKPAEESAPAPEDWTLEAGEDFPVPEDNLRSFEKACKDAKLTKEQAAAVLGWHKSFHASVTEAAARREEDTVKAWQAEILADPEIGGDHWKQAVADSRRALRAFDTDGSLRKLLRDMRADYHPAVVRTIARVGRAMAEDRFIHGNGGGSSAQKPLEERLWAD